MDTQNKPLRLGPLFHLPSLPRVLLHSLRRPHIQSSNFFNMSSLSTVEIYSEPPDAIQANLSGPITISNLGLDASEKENERCCRRCKRQKPLQEFAKSKSRGSNSLNDIDTDGSRLQKECNTCLAKRKVSQGKANAVRRKGNEKAKSKLLDCYTWEETLAMIDAGFVSI